MISANPPPVLFVVRVVVHLVQPRSMPSLLALFLGPRSMPRRPRVKAVLPWLTCGHQ